MSPESIPERPWFTSPLLPAALCLVGVTTLLLQGLTPYRVFLRRRSWKVVTGHLTSAVERRAKVRSTARGESRLEYLVKRPQRPVVSKVVSRGWPLSTKRRVWLVRVNYTFPWKTGRITRLSDSPSREFETRKEAQEFLARRVKKGAIRVWVNPDDPREATAFLDYPSRLSLVLGFAMLLLGLCWGLAAGLLGRAHRRRESSQGSLREPR